MIIQIHNLLSFEYKGWNGKCGNYLLYGLETGLKSLKPLKNRKSGFRSNIYLRGFY
jgi:hypothetical protein